MKDPDPAGCEAEEHTLHERPLLGAAPNVDLTILDATHDVPRYRSFLIDPLLQ